MARKLKTYQTSLGFFAQAITVPSVKAALEVALDLGPYAYEFHWLRAGFQTFATKLGDTSAAQLRGYRDPLFTG
jgi:hypothetical protein